MYVPPEYIEEAALAIRYCNTEHSHPVDNAHEYIADSRQMAEHALVAVQRLKICNAQVQLGKYSTLTYRPYANNSLLVYMGIDIPGEYHEYSILVPNTTPMEAITALYHSHVEQCILLHNLGGTYVRTDSDAYSRCGAFKANRKRKDAS